VGVPPVAVEVQEILAVDGRESRALASRTASASAAPGRAYFAEREKPVVALAIHRRFVTLATLRGVSVVGQGDYLHLGK
jgi:hypothetical protein